MPDTKITALTAIGANPIIPSTFPIPMVDLTDTSMAASGTTKKVTVNQILGAGGTATLASATITGNLTVDTNTFFADSANNRVGIGTASPAVLFHAALPAATFGEVGRFYDSSGNGISFTANASSGFNQITSTGSQPLIVNVNSSERYRIASDGVATWSNVGGVAGTAMTLNSTGLGIGASPASYGGTFRTLAVNATDAGILDLMSNSVSQFRIFGNGSENRLGGITNVPLTFHTNNSEKMRLDASGNLLVGTTAAAAGRLDVRRTTVGRGINYFSTASGDLAQVGLYIAKFDNDSTTSQKFIAFSINNDSAGSGQINANGANQAAFGSFSDSRLKENIVSLPSQLDNILSLRPVEFDYKDGSGHQIGFVAQEMQEVYSDAVGEQNGFLTVTGWSKTEARLVSAIKELAAKVQALEAKLA